MGRHVVGWLPRLRHPAHHRGHSVLLVSQSSNLRKEEVASDRATIEANAQPQFQQSSARPSPDEHSSIANQLPAAYRSAASAARESRCIRSASGLGIRQRHQRYSALDVASGIESGVHNDLYGRLHGADDCLGIYCVSAEISGNAVQCGQKSSERIHWYEL